MARPKQQQPIPSRQKDGPVTASRINSFLILSSRPGTEINERYGPLGLGHIIDVEGNKLVYEPVFARLAIQAARLRAGQQVPEGFDDSQIPSDYRTLYQTRAADETARSAAKDGLTRAVHGLGRTTVFEVIREGAQSLQDEGHDDAAAIFGGMRQSFDTLFADRIVPEVEALDEQRPPAA